MFPPAGTPQGALRSFGEHKGYVLAVMCELLGAAVTGGHTIRPETLTHEHAVWNNMLATVFDPARLGSSTSFGHGSRPSSTGSARRRSSRAAQAYSCRANPSAPRRRARAEWVPVDAGTLAQLDDAAARVQAARGSSPGPLSRRPPDVGAPHP